MNNLTRILAVVDRTAEDELTVSKAVALAQHHQATLELFLCEAQRAYSLLHAYDQNKVDAFRRECLRDSRTYLESLRQTAVCSGVQITMDAACESPLYEAIVRKVVTSGADLVIRSVAGARVTRRFALDASDWQLIRACPATLLLSRSKSWQPCPRFLAAVDMSGEESSALSRHILEVCAQISAGCQGQIDIAYSEPADVDMVAHQRHIARLQAFAAATSAAEVHSVSGLAEEALPELVARRGYDGVVMGALTHRQGISALVGTLTSKLVESLDCDFVLVKPDMYQTEVMVTANPAETPAEELAQEPVPERAAQPGFVCPWQLPPH